MSNINRIFTVPGKEGDDVVLDLRGARMRGAADGETVTIIRFSERCEGRTQSVGVPPGVWKNYAYATVRDARGAEHDVPADRLLPPPGKDYLALGRELIRALPDTKFWEDDLVEVYDGRRGRISYIDYTAIENPTSTSRPYRVDFTRGYEEFHERSIDLVERGNVWRYYNGEALAVEGPVDEAAFYQKTSLVTYSRNLESGTFNFKWDEAVQALRDGRIDAIWNWTDWKVLTVDPNCSVAAFTIDDPEVGERIRESLLAEIEAASVPAY